MDPRLIAEALGRCHDDTPADDRVVDWAAEQLLDGAEFDGVVAALTEAGWTDDAATAAVEQARVLTRRDRGVVTRDDVLADLNHRYRRSTTGMAGFYRACGGPVGIVAFFVGLRSAVASFRRLSRLRRTPGLRNGVDGPRP